jgi:hypothetical protein
MTKPSSESSATMTPTDHAVTFGMTASEWIAAITAIGAFATAVFTGMIAAFSCRQARLLLPVVNCSAAQEGKHVALYAGLGKMDAERHFIARIDVLSPWGARLIRPDWGHDGLDHIPIPSNERGRRLLFDGSPVNPPIALIESAGSLSIKVRFHVALRADSSAVRRYTTRIRIND